MDQRRKSRLDNPLLQMPDQQNAVRINNQQPAARHKGVSKDVKQPKRGGSVQRPQTLSGIKAHRSSDSPKQAKAVSKQTHLPKQMRSGVLKRQFVAPVEIKRYSHPRRQLRPKAVLAVASLLFIIGGLIILDTLSKSQAAKKQVAQLASESAKTETLGISDAAPDETIPTMGNLTSYKTAPELPRFLTIQKTNTTARVRQIRIIKDSVLLSPKNTHDVGWYQNSSKPGETGAVVIGGHVSGPTRPGVFGSIGSLKAGDKISLERGDGKTFNYTVILTHHYDNDKIDIQKLMAPITKDKPGLNLVTSSSRFNITTNKYEQRIVVFAEQDGA